MDLQIKVEPYRPDAAIVHLKGSVDSGTYEEFRDRLLNLLDHGTRHLLLEMTEVKYISSSGLGVFFEVRKKLEKDGGVFGLYNPQLSVHRVLEIVKSEDLALTQETTEPKNPFFDYVRNRELEKLKNNSEKKEEIRKSEPAVPRVIAPRIMSYSLNQ